MEELYKQKIIDFIEGKADACEFYKWIESTPDVLVWLQSKVPEGATMKENIEEKIDYYLAKLPEEKQKEIYEAYGALCLAIENGSEEKLDLARELVELMGALEKEGIISMNVDLPALLLFNLNKVFSDVKAYKPDYVEYMINSARELFEKKYNTVQEVPYNVKTMYEHMTMRAYGRLGACLNLQGYLFGFMRDFLHEENLVRDEALGERRSFMIDVCPEYIDGVEIDEADIIEKIIAEVPENLPKTKRKKEIKEKIKAAFHIDGKYPRWVQGGEWPVSASGKPMRFIGQKRKKGKGYENMLYTIYTFEDVDTGEIRTVEQFT